MAGHTAERIRADYPDAEGQVASAIRQTLERQATPDESRKLVEFTRTFGLTETCRLLLNLNEFVFVD
jgi:hypothetical protein